MATVSVVIPSYNSVTTISRCLRSVLAQTYSEEPEVIVVDSSRDGTAELVKADFCQVKLVARSQRILSGAARNIGVEASTGQFICFIDSDCVAEETWVAQMMEAHASGDFAAVAGSVVNGNAESPVSWASYITEFSEYMPAGRTRQRISSPTCNISYRRETFERHGGFDERLRMYVDYEFNTRLRNTGERLLFVPEIRVKHWHRTSTAAYLKHELRRGRAAVMLRRAGLLPGGWAARSRVVCPIIAPAMVVRRVAADVRRFAPARMTPTGMAVRVVPAFLAGSMAWGMGFLLEGLRSVREAYVPAGGRELALERADSSDEAETT